MYSRHISCIIQPRSFGWPKWRQSSSCWGVEIERKDKETIGGKMDQVICWKTYTNGKMLTRKGRLAQLNKFKYGGVIIWIWFIGSISDDYMQVKISGVQILKQISPLILGMRVNKDYLFIWLNWTSPVAVITPCLGLHSITSHTSSPWICLHQSLRHIFSRLEWELLYWIQTRTTAWLFIIIQNTLK